MCVLLYLCRVYICYSGRVCVGRVSLPAANQRQEWLPAYHEAL